MPESAMIITPLHILYLVGSGFCSRRNDPEAGYSSRMHPVSFSAGRSGLHSFIGGIQTVFNAILYAARGIYGDHRHYRTGHRPF